MSVFLGSFHIPLSVLVKTGVIINLPAIIYVPLEKPAMIIHLVVESLQRSANNALKGPPALSVAQLVKVVLSAINKRVNRKEEKGRKKKERKKRRMDVKES